MGIGRFSPLTYTRDVQVSPHDPERLYSAFSIAAVSDAGSLYRSDDFGESWHRFDHGVDIASTLMVIGQSVSTPGPRLLCRPPRPGLRHRGRRQDLGSVPLARQRRGHLRRLLPVVPQHQRRSVMTRLAPILERDALPEDHRSVYDYLVQTRGRVSPGMGVLLHSPDVTGRIVHVGTYVRFESSSRRVPARSLRSPLLLKCTTPLSRPPTPPAPSRAAPASTACRRLRSVGPREHRRRRPACRPRRPRALPRP